MVECKSKNPLSRFQIFLRPNKISYFGHFFMYAFGKCGRQLFRLREVLNKNVALVLLRAYEAKDVKYNSFHIVFCRRKAKRVY